MKQLSEKYKEAALKAKTDGVIVGNENALALWIKANCTYSLENEYFLVLGIGCALADLAKN